MKTKPALSRRAEPTGATKACAHDVPALERLHRARIAELNGTVRHDHIYYTEATIDRGMKELVGLLNNRLTFSTHACHGHWAPGVRRQDPYVVFRVLPGRGGEWRRLQRRVFTGLTRSLTGNTTLHVEDYYDLPHSTELFCWRFGPADRKRARKAF